MVHDVDGIAIAGRDGVDFGDTGGTVEVFTGRTFGKAVGIAVGTAVVIAVGTEVGIAVGLSSHSGRSCVVSISAGRSLKEIFLGRSDTRFLRSCLPVSLHRIVYDLRSGPSDVDL